MALDTATVAALYRYPVKGLSADGLDTADLTPGAPMPFDRAFAIENGARRFDPEKPRPLPKISFLMLMRNERLATLRSRFDEPTTTLSIARAGKDVVRGDLTTKLGRQTLEQFFAAYMKDDLRGAPRIVSAPGHAFADVGQACLHIVNRASIADLERVTGRPIDPLRFRANVYLDGLPAWQELAWLDRQITIGADARLDVFARTQRCEATNVDPATGARDSAIPRQLQRAYGHADMGVYARVSRAGTIRTGDEVALSPHR